MPEEVKNVWEKALGGLGTFIDAVIGHKGVLAIVTLMLGGAGNHFAEKAFSKPQMDKESFRSVIHEEFALINGRIDSTNASLAAHQANDDAKDRLAALARGVRNWKRGTGETLAGGNQ